MSRSSRLDGWVPISKRRPLTTGALLHFQGVGVPLLEGYLLRIPAQDGVSGSKGLQPMQFSLHVSISETFSLSSFLHSCHHLPYLFILPPERAGMGLVRTPASRGRSQGPKIWVTGTELSAYGGFCWSSRASLKLPGWEEFSCSGNSSSRLFLHSTTTYTSPPAWPHVCPFCLQRCQDFYLLFFFFTAAISHLFLSNPHSGLCLPQTSFLASPKMCI